MSFDDWLHLLVFGSTSTPFSRTVNFLDVSQATSLRQPDTMLERYQQLHWLDVRVAVPPLFTTWIDHKRSLFTAGRFTAILWSIFIHLSLHQT